jgi:tetratricopeptide (TPR) repeat protein
MAMRHLGPVRLASGAALALLLLQPSAARAQRAELTLDSGEAHAGAPFVLSLRVEGFAEAPPPDVAAFRIAGCKTTSLGVSPSVASSISIINGRRSESREVTFVHRYQVVCDRAGSYKVPAIAVTQGKRRANSRPGRFNVRALGASEDMALRVGLPDRPVAVGETFDVTIDWYLGADPDDPSFSIPVFDRSDEFEVSAPPRQPGDRNAVPFTVGGRDVELPFTRDKAELDGRQYTRFRFTAQVTPLKPGRFDLGRAGVVARLPVGWGRDAFGFRVPRTAVFRAEDQPRTLEVSPLPAQGQPPGFAGAVGVGFSIEARASQTVVRVGDPIELDIVVRGGGRLEGVGLPDLAGPGGLPRADFDVPTGKPAGQIIDDGKAKRFAVTVRLLRPVTQIPPIQFSYWNPARRAYEVATSQAIALSVAGGRAVGAGDVVAGAPDEKRAAGKRDRGRAAPDVAAGSGVDLSPSAPDATLRRPLTMSVARPIVIALYGAPTLLLGFTLLRQRRRRRGAAGGASRAARGELERALERAATAPAREVAPAIATALRALLRAAGQPTSSADALTAELENRAFDPALAGAPLPADLVGRVRERAAALRPGGKPDRGGPSAGGRGPGAAALLALLVTGLAARALAGETDPLADARGAYQAALGEADRAARTRAFARAESMYRSLVAEWPDRPELLTDWGNAALGASDLGTAVLAYRRALVLDPALERAQANLSWVRGQEPDWAAAREEGGALDSLLFWHRRMTGPAKHILAAAAYALLLLLLVPLGPRRHARLRRGAALVPGAVVLAMWGSLAGQRDLSRDAVVVSDGVVLRAADNPGAPAVISEPVPAGAEATILEQRESWNRILLPGGSAGWLPAGALARLDPASP